MDILLRNVDPVAVKKFDEMAKKKSISRQELLNSILTKVAYEKEMSEKKHVWKCSLQKVFKLWK